MLYVSLGQSVCELIHRGIVRAILAGTGAQIAHPPPGLRAVIDCYACDGRT